jgi:hypothetical protein
VYLNGAAASFKAKVNFMVASASLPIYTKIDLYTAQAYTAHTLPPNISPIDPIITAYVIGYHTIADTFPDRSNFGGFSSTIDG